MKQMNIARLLPRLKEIKLTSNTHYIKFDRHLSSSFSSYLFPLLTSVTDSKTMSPHRVSTSPAEVKDERQQKQAMMKCPRCDSPNTKFCYYNNYSLAQPRHFCKTCRRYWTKGGALRNVPIGGGCRKNKEAKSSSRESGSSSSGLDGLKFFHGLSPPMKFQHLGGLSYPQLNVTLAPKNCYNHISSFGDPSASSATGSSCSFSLDPSGSSNALMGFHYLPVENINSFNAQSSLGTSIESLSYLNQDLHWKLQQQRLATLLVGDGSQRDITRDVASMPLENQNQKLQRPIVFQNLDGSKLDVSSSGEARKEVTSCGDTSTGLYFGNSYAVQPMNIVGTGNKNALSGSSWSGIQSWTDLHQFQGLH